MSCRAGGSGSDPRARRSKDRWCCTPPVPTSGLQGMGCHERPLAMARRTSALQRQRVQRRIAHEGCERLASASLGRCLGRGMSTWSVLLCAARALCAGWGKTTTARSRRGPAAVHPALARQLAFAVRIEARQGFHQRKSGNARSLRSGGSSAAQSLWGPGVGSGGRSTFTTAASLARNSSRWPGSLGTRLATRRILARPKLVAGSSRPGSVSQPDISARLSPDRGRADRQLGVLTTTVVDGGSLME